MKRCIIINPSAGSVKDLEALLKELERLPDATIRVSKKAGDAGAFAREAAREGFDEVVAVGGDGTLNEVINGIAERFGDIRLGLIPRGTGNDFARCLNLPATVDENIDIILAGKTTGIDVVRADSDQTRYFVNVSAGGFSGLVNEKLTPELKQTWGPFAYARGAAEALAELRAYRTDVILDEKESFSLDLYNVAVANGRFVAGGLPIAPKAEPDDGLLDLILISARPAAEMAVLVAKLLLGTHLDSDTIVFRRATHVSVRSTPGIWFNVDGELIGNEPIAFEVMPRALHFVVGKK